MTRRSRRRDFLKHAALWTLSAGVALGVAGRATRTDGADERPVQFVWHVPDALKESVATNLEFDGTVEQGRALGVPLIFVFAGVALLPYLAKAVLAVRRELVKCGLVIDARQADKPIEITQECSIDGGMLVVLAPEGPRFYERGKIEGPAELIKALRSGD